MVFWLVWRKLGAYYARTEPVTSCIGQNMLPLTTSWLLTYSLPSCCISPLCFFIHFCLRWKFWGRLFFPGSILREINRDHSSQALALSKGSRREPLIDWDEDDWGLWVGWLVWWHGTLFGPQQALGEVVGGTPITGFDAIEFLPKSKISHHRLWRNRISTKIQNLPNPHSCSQHVRYWHRKYAQLHLNVYQIPAQHNCATW